MATITKKELVNRIAERTGQTKVITKDIIQLFLDEIIRELANGNRLEFREFGVFEVKDRKARRAQNPRTLEKVHVPEKKVVKFKVGRIMREKVSSIPTAETSSAGETGSPGPEAPPPPREEQGGPADSPVSPPDDTPGQNPF
jgi:integration host factor subunit beta